MEKQEKRWMFKKDEDSHNYLIPAEKSELFNKLCQKAYIDDEYDAFLTEFDKYRSDSPSNYTFIKPEEIG